MYQQFTPTAPISVGSMIYSSPAAYPADPEPDPMRISSLLSPGAGSRSGSSSISGKHSGGVETKYKLNIRQQPATVRSCGFGERDRRVVDPPPIVQLVLEDPDLTEDEMINELRACRYVMTCSIYDESGAQDASFMAGDYQQQQRRLTDNLAGTNFVGKDEFGIKGCFFCFPDLSCRTPGAFRLSFSLTKIDPLRAKIAKWFPVLVEAKSEVFIVYNAKGFPGMLPSTELTKRLREQGGIIPIKKRNNKSKNTGGHNDSSDRDQEEGA